MSNRSASNPVEPERNTTEPHTGLSGVKVPGGPPYGDVKPQSRAVPKTGSGKSTTSSSSGSGGDGGRKYGSASDEASVPEADVNDDFMNAGIHDQTKSYQSNASSRQHSSVGDKYGRPSRGTKSAVAINSLSDAHKEDDDGDTQIHATVQAFPTRGSPVPSSTTSLVRDAEDRAESFLRNLARRSEQFSPVFASGLADSCIGLCCFITERNQATDPT